VAVLLANLYLFTYELGFHKQPVFVKPLPSHPQYQLALQNWDRKHARC
jgi:hypothetical protein